MVPPGSHARQDSPFLAYCNGHLSPMRTPGGRVAAAGPRLNAHDLRSPVPRGMPMIGTPQLLKMLNNGDGAHPLVDDGLLDGLMGRGADDEAPAPVGPEEEGEEEAAAATKGSKGQGKAAPRRGPKKPAPKTVEKRPAKKAAAGKGPAKGKAAQDSDKAAAAKGSKRAKAEASTKDASVVEKTARKSNARGAGAKSQKKTGAGKKVSHAKGRTSRCLNNLFDDSALQPKGTPVVPAKVAKASNNSPGSVVHPVTPGFSTPGGSGMRNSSTPGREGNTPGGAQTVTKKKGKKTAGCVLKCNCRKSRCLKLYCECFAAGRLCEDDCSCQNCSNTEANIEEVEKTRKAIKQRNPHAFAPKINMTGEGGKTPRHKKGCHCKKSHCLKKYCECFQAGVKCTDVCRCENCKNTGPDPDEKQSTPDSMTIVKTGGIRMARISPTTPAIADGDLLVVSSSAAKMRPFKKRPLPPTFSSPQKRCTILTKRTLEKQEFSGFTTSLKIGSILRPPPSPLGLGHLATPDNP